MTPIRVPAEARLIMGVLWSDAEALRRARIRMERLFGKVAAESRTVPFGEYSNYYRPEMGDNISRVFWHLGNGVPRGSLVEIKLASIRIEKAAASANGRLVNLDPGLLSLESVVLATTKGYAHRVYLAKGIYAELALVYRKGSGYEPLPWTYRDYRETWVREFFEDARKSMTGEAHIHD